MTQKLTAIIGMDFGDELFKKLMSKLGSASAVACLLAERSLGLLWILYEARGAKGKLDTPVEVKRSSAYRGVE